MTGPATQAEALAFYADRKIPVTPVKPNEKKGRLTGWSTNRAGATPSDFRPGDNIGVLNGTIPGDTGWVFHDIDIDANSDGARRIVEALLPKTGWWYGRAGKPRSHANYLVKGALRSRRHAGLDGRVILELRGVTQKSSLTLSVGPGSIHTSGEAIRFAEPIGQIGAVSDPAELELAVQHAAVAIILLTIWPATNRHVLRLAFAKIFLEAGLTVDQIIRLLEAVMRETGSDVNDVAGAVRDTDATMRAGRQTAGTAMIIELLGQPVLAAINKILKLVASDDGASINVLDLSIPMLDRAWQKIVVANDPPGVFKRDQTVVILRDCANTCLAALYEEQLRLVEPSVLRHLSGFRDITPDTFREIIGRMIPCVEIRGATVKPRVYPGKDFTQLLLSTPAFPLPEPNGFTTVPFFTLEGHLVTQPGLHAATGMFYQPTPDFQLPEIAEAPSPRDVGMALTLLDEMIWQFPFQGRKGRHPYLDLRADGDWRTTTAFANTLAFPLTVLMRSLFHAVPLFLVDKPASRTGASLLVQCWCYILQGTWPSEAEWATDESERRKFLTSILRTGAPVIFLDEVKDLRSPDLNKILTGKGARVGRTLGSTEIVDSKNYSTFIATGNNPEFPRDMAGRMCRIRLDTSTERPGHRNGWDKDLIAWVPQHRSALLGALYTLVRAWFAAGRPNAAHGRALAGFEAWSVTIGGVLAHAGIEAFLANKTQVEDEAVGGEDEEDDDTSSFVEAWYATYHTHSVLTEKLLLVPGLPLRDSGQPWQPKDLGYWLRKNRDKQRTLTDGSVVAIKPSTARRYSWRLTLCSEAAPAIMETVIMTETPIDEDARGGLETLVSENARLETEPPPEIPVDLSFGPYDEPTEM